MVFYRQIAKIDQLQVPWGIKMHTLFFLEKYSMIFRQSKNNKGYTETLEHFEKENRLDDQFLWQIWA